MQNVTSAKEAIREIAIECGDRASHTALIKVLIKAGVLNDSTMRDYQNERAVALTHATTLATALTFVSLFEKEGNEDGIISEISREAFAFGDFTLGGVHAAIAYLPYSDIEREKLKDAADVFAKLLRGQE